jgi:HSP20 family protein
VAFARWDPLRDLLVIQRLNRSAPRPDSWTPAVDLHETQGHYTLVAELPGVSREDVHLEFDEGRLTISGRRRPRESAGEQYHCLERGYGPFSRTFQLPVPVDRDGITADLRDGVLTITCPKLADGAVRRIEIT